MQHFYDFEATDIKGNTIKMDTYRGKVVVVVNTASKCGLTPQYEGLELLYKKYKDRGLVILGFPCNQFAGQEPGDENDIASFCTLNYGVSFPMFAKVDVNGANAHPIFAFLTKSLKGFLIDSIKWNFTKFLLDKQGNPIKRYAPTDSPSDMEQWIVKLLDQA